MKKKKKIRPAPITEEQKRELERKNLPEFREGEKRESPQPEPEPETESPKEKEDSGPGLDDDEKIFDIDDICRDLADMPFTIWSIANPNVPPLDDKEKDRISKYLIKFAVKHKVAKYLKDELMLIAVIGYAVMKRAGIKKDVDDNSRQERERENVPGEKTNPV